MASSKHIVRRAKAARAAAASGKLQSRSKHQGLLARANRYLKTHPTALAALEGATGGAITGMNYSAVTGGGGRRMLGHGLVGAGAGALGATLAHGAIKLYERRRLHAEEKAINEFVKKRGPLTIRMAQIHLPRGKRAR